MSTTVEVVETSTEIVEVLEAGPAGPGVTHNPLVTLLASSKDVVVLPLHDGTVATETTILFGPVVTNAVDVTAGIMTTLLALDGFSANIEVHTIASAPGGKTVQMALWSEISLDAGVTWTVVPNSLHVNDVRDTASGSHTISIAEGTAIPAGVKTRLRVAKLGDIGTTLTISAAPDLLTSNGNVAGDATKATMFYRESL